MPNLKIYVDEGLYPTCKDRLASALEPIRTRLCADLDVPPNACQFAVMTVLAMPDLPRVGVEMFILPRPDRTREKITAVCTTLQAMVEAATGTHVAVRAGQLDPATYVALK